MTQEHPLKLIEEQIFSVGVFLVDKAYGGPEEGGWWYTYGNPVFDVGLPVPIVTTNEDEAVTVMNDMNKWIEDQGLNKGRPSIGSVLSKGEYRAVITDGPVPVSYPETRPHYE
jgi:hypothetical protein